MSLIPGVKAASKSSKQSKVVVLRLKPDLLSKFPASSQSSGRTGSDASSSPVDTTEAASNGTPIPADGILETGSTKKKPGVKPGIKRNASAANLDGLKPKGKPGPKKKPRNADGTIDRSQDAPRPTVAVTSTAPKLGPKANTGAINAGLRALDRSGKPCRRWDRKGFNLKSFTGVTWDVTSWRAPIRASLAPDSEGKSDGSSTGDNKPRIDSSVVPSESSRGGDGALGLLNGIASSPAAIPV